MKDVRVSYGESFVVNGASIAVQPGEVSCLMGRNGAGKTTLMKAIMGILPIRGGSVSVFGQDVRRWRDWWKRHKDQPNEHWLEERLAYQTTRATRLDADLARARAQVVQLHQQLYGRLPVADRLGHVVELLEQEDPALRALAANWGAELWPTADAVGQRTLQEALLRLSRDGNPEVQRLAVVVRVRPGHRWHLTDFVGGRAVEQAEVLDEPDPEGWTRLRLQLDWPDEAPGHLLGMGGDLEVLEPPEVRERLVALASGAVARHATSESRR